MEGYRYMGSKWKGTCTWDQSGRVHVHGIKVEGYMYMGSKWNGTGMVQVDGIKQLTEEDNGVQGKTAVGGGLLESHIRSHT